MDFVQLSAIAVTILTPLSPYLIKVGEAIAGEVGKKIFAQSKALYATLREKFEQVDDVQAKDTLETLYQASETDKNRLTESIVQYAQADAEFARVLSSQTEDIRMLLFDCLQNKFLARDLRQVYFRLDIGFDDLVGGAAGRSEKAIALIEHVTVRERVSDASELSPSLPIILLSV